MTDDDPPRPAPSGPQVLPSRQVHVHPSLAPRAAEVGGDLGRLPEVEGVGPSLVVAEDHMGSGHVSRMEPVILGARHAEGELVVLPRTPPDEQGQTA